MFIDVFEVNLTAILMWHKAVFKGLNGNDMLGLVYVCSSGLFLSHI